MAVRPLRQLTFAWIEPQARHVPTPPPRLPPLRRQTTTICLLNKQVSRVLLQNQTLMTTIRTVYAGEEAVAAISPSGLAGLGMPKARFQAFAQVSLWWAEKRDAL